MKYIKKCCHGLWKPIAIIVVEIELDELSNDVANELLHSFIYYYNALKTNPWTESYQKHSSSTSLELEIIRTIKRGDNEVSL